MDSPRPSERESNSRSRLSTLGSGGAAALRSTRRLPGEVVRLLKVPRQLARAEKQQIAAESSLRMIRASLDAQRQMLETIVAAQIEANRVLATCLDEGRLGALLERQLRQQQAMVNLFEICRPQQVIPAMGGLTPTADVIALLIAQLLQSAPSLVVECGSGVSTLWLALAIRRRGLASRIVCLDHDEVNADKTTQLLKQHEVDQLVEIRRVGLVPGVLEEHSTDWYDPSALEGLADIGLLFVAAPSERTGPMARYPAVPLMRELFAPTATIVLDGVARPAERETATRWRIQLPDFDYDQSSPEIGAACFRRLAKG